MPEEKTKEKKKEIEIGKVTHFFSKISVGIIEMTEGSLKIGDTIHIKDGARDFEQKVESMQIEHEQIEEAKKGDVVGTKVDQGVREGDKVYKIEE